MEGRAELAIGCGAINIGSARSLGLPTSVACSKRQYGSRFEFTEGIQMAVSGPSATDQYVGSRIRMRRSALALSQGKLADGLGITFQQVQKYEKGTNRVSASRLQQISHVLKVPIAFFFDGLPEGSVSLRKPMGIPAPDDIIRFMATADGRELMRSFKEIKRPQLRRSIVRMVEALESTKNPRR